MKTHSFLSLFYTALLVASCSSSLEQASENSPNLSHIEGTEIDRLIVSFNFENSVESLEGTVLDCFSYSGNSLDLDPHTTNSRSTDFSTDGQILYVVGRNTENVAAFALSSPWSLENAVFSQSLDLSEQLGSAEQGGSTAHGLYFRKNDGQRLWVWNRREMWAYDLAIAWDLSDSHVSAYQSFIGTLRRGHDMDFRPDGRRMFIDDRDSQAIFQYNLNEPWDIENAELDFVLDLSEIEDEVRGIEFSPDGMKLFVVDTGRREIWELQLVSPYELRGASLKAVKDVSDYSSNPRGITFKPDFSRFYLTSTSDNKILEFVCEITD